MLDRGPHDVAALGPSGDVAETIRPPGRPVHRVIRNRELGASSWPEEDTRFVWAPWWPVRILHFPVRSSAQFKRRTQIAIFEGMFPDRGRFRRLREHYEAGRFEELYGELIFDRVRGRRGAADGTAGRRRAVRPPAGPVSRPARRAGRRARLRVEPSPEELERDRAALEFDAMHVLARTSRWLMVNRERNRERMAKLIEQRDAAQARERSGCGGGSGARVSAPGGGCGRAFGR